MGSTHENKIGKQNLVKLKPYLIKHTMQLDW